MRIISLLTPQSPRKFAYLFITIQHQLHSQSTFTEHQSECMNNTTKLMLKHSKLKASPFVHSPSMQNSGEKSVLFRPPAEIEMENFRGDQKFGLLKSNCSTHEEQP